MLNLESIDDRVIEVHLRFTDQWPDLYGKGWLAAVVRLYQHGVWDWQQPDAPVGYSVVLFGPHGRDYRHPPAELVARHGEAAGISSIQITFHADLTAAQHAMPPGGFRLAIINCWDLDAGREARRCLAQHFLWGERVLERRPAPLAPPGLAPFDPFGILNAELGLLVGPDP